MGLSDFDAIKDAYKLYESFEQNRDAVYARKNEGGSGKVTDLFFVHTGHGLEFVKKYSVKGQWERFTNWIQGGKRFAIEDNLQKAEVLFGRFFKDINSASPEELEKAADQLGIKDTKGISKGEKLRHSLMELGAHLEQLKYRTTESLQGKTIERQSELIGNNLQLTEQLAQKALNIAITKKPQLTNVLTKALEDLGISFEPQQESKEKKALNLSKISAEKFEEVEKLFKSSFSELESGKKAEAEETLHQLKQVLDRLKTLNKQAPDSSKELQKHIHGRLEVIKKINIPKITLAVQSTFAEVQQNKKVLDKQKEVQGKLATLLPRGELSDTQAEVVSRVLSSIPDSELHAVHNKNRLLSVLRGSLQRSSSEDKTVIRSVLSQLMPAGEVTSSSILSDFLGRIGGDKYDFSSAQGEMLEDFLKKDPTNPYLTKLSEMIDQKMMLWNADERIKEVMIPPTNKCLVRNSSDEFSSCYEFERINKESEHKQEWILRIHDQNQNCFEFTGLTRKQLFGKPNILGIQGPSILGALQECDEKSGDEARDYFIKNVLSKLPEHPQSSEAIVKQLFQKVSPNAVCSRLIQGVVANSVPKEERARVLFEYEMYFFDRIENELATIVSQTDEKFLDKCDTYRQFHSMIKQALPEFAERVSKSSGSLTDEDKARLKDSLAMYEDLLDQLNTKLMESEKKIYSQNLETLEGAITPFVITNFKGEEVPPESKIKEVDPIQLALISHEGLQALKAIEAIGSPDDKDFSSKVATSLELLNKVQNFSEAYFYACDSFCKKMGSLDAWDKVEDPNGTIQRSLETLTTNMSSLIDSGKSEGSRAERYGLFLFATHGRDRLFHQWAEKANFSHKFPSPLASSAIRNQVEKLQTSDPFWAKAFEQIRQLEGQGEADKLFDMRLYSNEKGVELSKAIVNSVLSWTQSTTNETGPVIRKSIEADRAKQETRIAREIELEQKELTKQEGIYAAAEVSIKSSESAIEQMQREIGEIKEKFNSTTEDTVKSIKKVLPQELQNNREFLKKIELEIEQMIEGKGAQSRGRRDVVATASLDSTVKEYLSKMSQKPRNQEIGSTQDKVRGIVKERVEFSRNIYTEKRKIPALEKQIVEKRASIKEKTIEMNSARIEIDKCKRRIEFEIRVEVRSDKSYWPWGIGQDDEQDRHEPSLRKWTEKEVASFYVGQPGYVEEKAQVFPLPEPFTQFANMFVLSENIFYKSQPGNIPALRFQMDSERSLGTLERNSFSCFSRKIERPDFYQAAFANQKSAYGSVYEHIYSQQKYVDELEIPHRVAVGLGEMIQGEKPLELERDAGYLERAKYGFNFAWGAAKGVYSAVKECIVGVPTVELNDELRELCQLHCSKDIQIDSCLAYFQENPKKLFESDGRLLFHTLFFESNLLLEALRDPQAKEFLIPSLRSLFHDAMTSSYDLREEDEHAAQNAADICWLASNVQKYINFVASSESRDLGDPVLTPATICSFIETFASIKYEAKWPIVYESLVAAAGNCIQLPIDSSDQKQLVAYSLFARVVQKRHKMTVLEETTYSKQACAPRQRDAERSEKLLKECMSTISSNDLEKMVTKGSQKIIGSMYESFKGIEFKEDPNRRGQAVFLSEDGKTTLSLSEGKFFSTDATMTQVATNPLDETVKGLLQNIYTDQEIGSLRCYMDGKVACIYDSNKDIHLKVDESTGAVFIENKKAKMPWCHCLVGKEDLGNRMLSNNFHQLYDVKTEEVYFCDKQTFQPVYKSVGGNIVKIGEPLSLNKPTENSPFAAFEDPSCSFYWSDERGLKLVEFPRLSLSLEKNKDGRWAEKGATEWLLAKEQFIPHLEQKNGFLLFENQKGEKKALFPVWDVSKRKDSQSVQYDFRAEEASGRYIEYLVKEDKLVPQTVEARFYLSKICLEKGSIDEAENLLYARSAEVTSRKLSEDEVSQLRSIAGGKVGTNSSPRLIRLRMHAMYLLEKNRQQFPKEVLKEEKVPERPMPSSAEIRSEIELATLYLDKAAGVRALEPREELLVLRKLEGKIASQPDLVDPDVTIRIQERVKALGDTLESDKGTAIAGINNIEQLSFFKEIGDRGGVIRSLRRDYFEESKEASKGAELPDLFPATSPELVKDNEFVKKKFADVTNDMAVAESRETAAFSLKSGKDLAALEKDFNDQIKAEKALLSHEETLIVNAVATALRTNPKTALELDAKIRFYPNMEELCLLCARKNYAEFAAKYYPELGEKGIESLQVAVKKYLFQKQAVQNLERSLNELQTLKKWSATDNAKMIEVSQNRLASSMDAMRAYPPDHKLAMIFLFLECTLNIKLRPDQVKNILLFDGGIIEDSEKVLQMIMGAGKTSVIQPILALLFAKPNTLSTIMVPEAQFPAVRDQLVVTLGHTFDQCVYCLPYDLDLAKDPQYLDDFLSNLKEAKDRQACLLLPPRIKHSILTSLYGAYFDSVHPESKGHEGSDVRVDKIAAICKFMEENELIQIDEIDMIMNPHIVFKRPIGDPVVYDKERDFARPTIVTELLLHLATSKTIRKEVSIDFIDAMQTKIGEEVTKQGAPITEKLYETKVQPELVDKACELLKKKSKKFTEEVVDNEYFKNFLTQKVPDDKDPVTYRREMNAWIREKVVDPADRDLVSACAHAIARVLPSSLQKEENAHYGKDPQLDASESAKRRYVARPYGAANAPKATSFADPIQKVIFSEPYYLIHGIPVADAREILLDWQRQARNEVKGGTPIKETHFYARFHELIKTHNLPVMDFLVSEKSATFDEVVSHFQKAISKDLDTLLEFFTKKLFPQIITHEKTSTSTPHTVTGSGHTSHGYTGTLYEAILSSTMKGIPEIGTDGQTILAVERKIINGDAKVDICSDAKIKLPDQVIAKFRDEGISVFIDSGGWLKQEQIDDYAVRLLDECKAKGTEGVVYHNADGKIVCLEIDQSGNKTIVPFDLSRLKNSPEKRITVIAQQYETGTNIGQTLDAKAFMSVRKDMTLRDGLQSIFRMRGILVGQSVSMGLSDDVQNHISNAFGEGLLSHKPFADLFAARKEISKEELQIALDAIKGDGVELEPFVEKALEKAIDSYNAFIREKPKSTEKVCVVSFLSCFSKEFIPDSKNIWKYLTINQAKSEESKGEMSATYRMQEIIEKPIRSLLTDLKVSSDERKKLFVDLEKDLVQTESFDLFTELTTDPEEGGDKIEKEVKRYLAILNNETVKNSPLYPQICANIKKEYGEGSLEDVLTERLKFACKDISEKRTAAAGEKANDEIEAEEEVELEHQEEFEAEEEKEQQVETEVEINLAIQKVAMPKIDLYEPLAPVINNKAYDNNALVDAMISLKAHSLNGLLPNTLHLPEAGNIKYSPNLFKDSDRLDSAAQASKHLASRYLLVCKKDDTSVNVLISHRDYELIKNGFTGEITGGREAVVYSLDGSVKAAAKKTVVSKEDKVALEPVFVTAKFCTAKSNFSRKEVDDLMSMINESEKPQELGAACRKYYEDRLEFLESAKKAYNSGDNYLAKKLSVFPTGRAVAGDVYDDLIPL